MNVYSPINLFPVSKASTVSFTKGFHKKEKKRKSQKKIKENRKNGGRKTLCVVKCSADVKTPHP